MVSREVGAVQLPLKEENLQEIYVFYPGAYPVYPKDGYPGAPTQVIQAEKIGRKVHGYGGFRALTTMHLFHRGADGVGHNWQRSVGTLFGAHSSKVHKRKT